MKYLLIDLFDRPISGEWGKEVEGEEIGLKVIRTTNFTNLGRLDLTDIVYRNIDLKKNTKKQLKFGDLIIEKSGGSPTKPVGRTVIFEEESNEIYFCNNFTAILRPNEKIYPKYALYLLKDLYNKRKVLKYQNKTTGIINLKLNDYLKNTEVEVPSVNTQKKVSNILDKAQELIDKRKTQIKALDELIKSKFIEMFGDVLNNNRKWDFMHIKEFAEIVSGSTPKTNNEENWDGEIDWITPAELTEDTFILNESVRKITKEAIKNTSLKSFPKGTVILSSRAPIGKVAIAGKEMYCNQGFKNLICDDRINPIYMYCLLKQQTKYLNSLGRGATFKEISKGIVGDIKVSVPPIELQNQFADFVKQVDKLKFEMENSLKELEDNFNSLMQRAFNGELFN